jgi:hypothetical protein
MKREPLHSNPDVAEVIANNRDACRHPDMSTVTRWVGGSGSPGMIGGQRPMTYWHCPACKQDVRPWLPEVDDPLVVDFLKRISEGPLALPNGPLVDKNV